MKLAALALCGLALAGCLSTPSALPPKADSAVAWAVEHTRFIPDPGCSAAEVAKRVAVTAKHCLPDDAKEGDRYDLTFGGVISYISPSHDFAVVVYPDPFIGQAYIDMRPARLGEHLYVVGFPMQLEDGEQQLTVTDGVMAGPVDSEQQQRITAPGYFGNSGGGVWADDGSLIGILVSLYAVSVEGYRYPVPYAGQNYMVPIQFVLPHLPVPQ